jgi:GGDEF domain-containing protein
MDVNQMSAIASVHPDAKKSPDHHDHNDRDGAKDDQNPNQSGSWRELDAVDVDASLMNGISADAQDIIDSLNKSIEPLRTELELAKHREAHFCDLAAQHSFLDIPCRREFLRELTHVLTHIHDLSVPPSVILLSLTGTEDVRLKAGRLGLDQVLREVTDTLSKYLNPTDLLGSLGGVDFGIILMSGGVENTDNLAKSLSGSITNHQFGWAGQYYELGVKTGWSKLQAEHSAEAILDTADRSLRA